MSKFKESYLTDKDGKKIGVFLDMGDYQDLLEDIEDLKMIADRKNEPTISLLELKGRIRRNSHLSR